MPPPSPLPLTSSSCNFSEDFMSSERSSSGKSSKNVTAAPKIYKEKYIGVLQKNHKGTCQLFIDIAHRGTEHYFRFPQLGQMAR